MCSGASTDSSSMLISTSGVIERRLEEARAAVHDPVPDGDAADASSSDGPFSANASSMTANPAV